MVRKRALQPRATWRCVTLGVGVCGALALLVWRTDLLSLSAVADDDARGGDLAWGVAAPKRFDREAYSAQLFGAAALGATAASSSSSSYSSGVRNASLPRVAACARVRNEARYLREWIEFHRLVGVEYFYIFDDDSRDETRQILEPYVRAGVVRVWPVSAVACSRHRGDSVCADRTHDADHGEHGFRDECLRVNPDDADWIAMLDVDEFLFPSAGMSLRSHLAENCAPSVAYALVRWHVFGSSGHRTRPEGLSSIEAYRERGRADDRGCYPRLTCGDEYSPPICAKVIANARCVQHQGTHYVARVRSRGTSGIRCESLYTPEGFGRSMGKAAAPKSDAWAREQHERCARPLHLNHYAVRSREDYVEKFERGRISSGARDAKLGLATKDATTGATSRDVPQTVVTAFVLGDEAKFGSTKANAAKTRSQLLLAEFARRDFSDVLDEAVLKYGPDLRAALGHAPAALDALPPRLDWACESAAGGNDSHARAAVAGESAAVEAASAWTSTARAAAHFARRVAQKRQPLALFVHIPKTAGTTLNLALAAAARREKRKFCELTFSQLERPRARAAMGRSCGLISAETDVTVLASLKRRAVAVVTYLREPLSRVASQYEHHLAGGRLGAAHGSHGDIVRVVSPQLCPQLERDARCAALRHPRKCHGGGWCSIFQNHQTHVLAGAQHFSREARAATRRSSANLICAAKRSLEALPFVGLTEQMRPSLCLLFRTLGYGGAYEDCCVADVSGDKRGTCKIFEMHATRHSAADRATLRPAKPTENSSYLDKYLDDDLLVAAIYEGNTLDCQLYELGARLVSAGLAAVAAAESDFAFPEPVQVSPLMRYCERGAQQLRRFKQLAVSTRQDDKRQPPSAANVRVRRRSRPPNSKPRL